MAARRVGPDRAFDELVRLYQQGERQLAQLSAAYLRRGFPRSAEYRRRQLLTVRVIVDGLRADGRVAVQEGVRRAYSAAAVASDRVTGLAGDFGGVHQRAVAAIARNMQAPLEQAATRAGQSAARIIAWADSLEGPLPTAEALGRGFLGRRIAQDVFRSAALEQVGQGVVGGAARREVSRALASQLVSRGITGFVDRAGRQWALSDYTRMVARTTTREAMSQGTVNRLREHGVDLVTISEHPNPAEVCVPYAGGTFTLTGQTPGYEQLDELPPFHPNCRHVVTPAEASFEEFERALGLAASEEVV